MRLENDLLIAGGELRKVKCIALECNDACVLRSLRFALHTAIFEHEVVAVLTCNNTSPFRNVDQNEFRITAVLDENTQ